MKLEELKAEMALRGMRYSNKTKEQIITRLEKDDEWAKKVDNPIGKFAGPTAKMPDNEKPKPMQFYCEHFNPVDRFNKYYYQLQYPFKTMEFQPVVVWAMLNCVFVSCWSIFCEKEGKITMSLTEAAREYAAYVLDQDD